MNRGAWQTTVHGIARVGHDLVTKITTKTNCTPIKTKQYPNKKNFKKQRKKPNLRPSPLGHTWFLLLTECPLCQWQLVLSMALTNSCHLGQGDYIVPSIFHCGKGKNFASPEYMHFMLIDLLSCILFLFTGQSMPYLLPRYQTKRGSAHLDTVKLTY